LDPGQWWNQRWEKATEHQSCQSLHVNGAIVLVGVNLIALSLDCHPAMVYTSAEILFRSFAMVG
jgi:hypothetical protein